MLLERQAKREQDKINAVYQDVDKYLSLLNDSWKHYEHHKNSLKKEYVENSGYSESMIKKLLLFVNE